MDKSPNWKLKVMCKMIRGNEKDTATQVEFELYAPIHPTVKLKITLCVGTSRLFQKN